MIFGSIDTVTGAATEMSTMAMPQCPEPQVLYLTSGALFVAQPWARPDKARPSHTGS